MRALYVTGIIYIAFSGLVLLNRSTHRVEHGIQPRGPQPGVAATADAALVWFRAMKPYCNPVEVETRQRWNPPPATDQGAAYSAACYALAGKMDRAREAIERTPASERWKAAGVVFNVAHPVADAGDDESAGPIMELVLEFWPNHYMALYHAGAARYALGYPDQARSHLQQFLELYDMDDGWRRNAIAMLKELEAR